jgi:hypothetical protein
MTLPWPVLTALKCTPSPPRVRKRHGVGWGGVVASPVRPGTNQSQTDRLEHSLRSLAGA